MISKTDSRGFTLIELVMVIVLLGILAAIAIPRFIDLAEDARKATARGVASGAMGAASMLHAQYLLKSTAYSVGATGGAAGEILTDANISGDLTVVATTPATGTAAPGTTDVTITIPAGGTNTYVFALTISITNGPSMVYGAGF